MRTILKQDFFARPALTVARELLGKFLVRKTQGSEAALMIIETEAYNGERDLACHARAGRTPRTAPMFEEGGITYIYFTYGMHWMLNFVAGKEGRPAAVLIRSAGEITGPARLTKALSIDKSLNAQKLGRSLGLWVEDRGIHVPARAILRTPRIGVDYAGEWKDKPWRFVLKNSDTLRV